MDELTILALYITLAGACSKLLQGIGEAVSAIKEIPHEVLALVNELSDLQLVLDETFQTSRSPFHKHSERTEQLLEPLLKRARSHVWALQLKLNEVSGAVDKVQRLSRPSLNGLKWIKLRSQIEKQRRKIRCIRMDISVILNTQRSLLSETQLRVEALLEKGNFDKSLQVQRGFSNDLQGLSKLSEISTKDIKVVSRIQSPQATLLTENTNVYASISNIRNRDFPGCLLSCQYPGHQKYYKSPERLRKLVGQISFCYSGRFKASQPTEGLCTCCDYILSRFTYYFPLWFFARALCLEFRFPATGAPSILLRIPRIIPRDSPAFKYCKENDIKGLKTLFSLGQASPSDIDEDGNTYLHIAVHYNHEQMCILLLEVGTDPSVMNSSQITVADLALQRSISNATSPIIKDLFCQNPDFRRQRFTLLHLAALGLIDTSVRSLLQECASYVNDLDASTRSPLYLAVRRADLPAVKDFLQFGADVSTGRSAIAWSCKEGYHTAECLELLLAHGSSPEGRDTDGHTALHACGIQGRGYDFIQPLLNAGADINAPYLGEYASYRGMTALGFACLYSRLETVQKLLSLGADPFLCDERGRSPIHLALTPSSTRTDSSHRLLLASLLQAGADIHTRDKRGYSPANIAMVHQDVDSLATLMDAGADVTYPEKTAICNNGYHKLSWTIENRWHLIFTFLLGRHEINAHDRDPISGQSVLHLLAQNLDKRMLVIFEEAVDLYGFGTDAFSDLVDNPEAFMHLETGEDYAAKQVFLDLIRRVKVGNPVHQVIGVVNPDVTKGSTKRLSSQSGKNLQAIEHQYIDGDITLSTATSSGLSYTEIQKHTTTKSLSSDEYLDGDDLDSDDLDSEIALMLWHPKWNKTRRKAQSEFHDSGYVSAESEYATEHENIAASEPTMLKRRRVGIIKGDLGGGFIIKQIQAAIATPIDDQEKFVPSTQTNQLEPNSSFTHRLSAAFAPWSVMCWSMLSAIKRHLIQALRPRIPAGFSRISWNCDCGTELYADFPSNDSDVVAELADALGASSVTSSSSRGDSSLPSMPHSAHLDPYSGHNTRILNQQSPQRNQTIGNSNSSAQIPISTPIPRFFELCINTGNFWQSLGEIDLTYVDNDNSLGQKISNRYYEVRGFRTKQHFLLKPVNIKYVSFGLENRHKVHIFEENSVPTHTDHYEWNPCPPKYHPPWGPVPRSAILHWLTGCKVTNTGDGTKATWLNQLPKRLHQSITQCSDDLPTAWGIHIIEGPDKARIKASNSTAGAVRLGSARCSVHCQACTIGAVQHTCTVLAVQCNRVHCTGSAVQSSLHWQCVLIN